MNQGLQNKILTPLLFILILIYGLMIYSCSSDISGSESEKEQRWTIANENIGTADYRWGHSLEVLNGKMWMFAGIEDREPKTDVWFSENGVEWFKATDDAGFVPRVDHTSVVYDNKIWIIGGLILGSFLKDIWYTEDGINWTQATADPPLKLRYKHSSAVFNNKMWVIGGHVIDYDKEIDKTVNDVWNSEDGINWNLATSNAAFTPRKQHQTVVFNNKLWVIGGLYWNGSSEEFLDDVWYSENGTDWNMATENAGFDDISGYKSVVFEGKIWLIGGSPIGGGASRDIWYSSDGIQWSKADPFFGRAGHAITVFNNSIWGVGGGDGNSKQTTDSWVLGNWWHK